MVLIAVRLPKELEERLTALAQKTGRSKSYHVRQALLQYLEDLEDHHLAEEHLESPPSRASPWKSWSALSQTLRSAKPLWGKGLV
jgi:RHH-type rel operon transcriptional repressor/antitoxin RelB